MSYAEIRDSLQSLTKEEREALALDLKALALLDDPVYAAEIGRRIGQYDASHAATSEDLARMVAERRGRAA